MSTDERIHLLSSILLVLGFQSIFASALKVKHATCSSLVWTFALML